MENNSKRIPSLDGLRAISIVLVIAGHFAYVLKMPAFGNLGSLGVRVFFVISGFLITGLLLKELEKTSKISLGKFYFRRTLRIFPPYYFYLLVTSAAAVGNFAAVNLDSIFYAATYTTDYINPQNWLLGHTWSLSVEEQFYLFLPGVLLLIGLRKTKILLFLLLIFCPLIRLLTYLKFGTEPIWVGKGFHANLDSLAIGCLLALFYKRLHRNDLYQKILRSKIVFILPPIILAMNFLSERPRVFLFAIVSLTNLLVAFCLDWAVVNYDSAIGKFLNCSLMTKLGLMSYSVYLWQQPFFNPESQSILTQTPFNFIGLALMTTISFYAVERYSLRARPFWEKKIFREKSPPETNLSSKAWNFTETDFLKSNPPRDSR